MNIQFKQIVFACAVLGGLLGTAAPALATMAEVVPARSAVVAMKPVFEIRDRFQATSPRQVALTFDACDGKFDWNLAHYLVDQHIPATIFVTELFLDRNPDAVSFLRQHRDVFEIGNHGEHHHAAILNEGRLYGVVEVGSPAKLRQEVDGGASAIARNFGAMPVFFRGATAAYSQDAVDQIHAIGEEVAGFSVAVDGGGKLGYAGIVQNVAAARDGDILLAHINHPEKRIGAGMIAGIQGLKNDGWQFVTLSQAQKDGLNESDRLLRTHLAVSP